MGRVLRMIYVTPVSVATAVQHPSLLSKYFQKNLAHLGCYKLFKLSTNALLLLGRVGVIEHLGSIGQGVVHQQLLHDQGGSTERKQNQM